MMGLWKVNPRHNSLVLGHDCATHGRQLQLLSQIVGCPPTLEAQSLPLSEYH